MTDFLIDVLLFAAIGVTCTVGLAVWLLAWGTRREKLAEAWFFGYNTAEIDRDHGMETPNPYLREHEALHRG